jgi:hypothetical protein
VRARYWKQTHKFGLLVPTTVKEELEIDQLTPKTGKEELEIDQLTERKAIALKMKNVQPAFKFLEGDERVSVPSLTSRWNDLCIWSQLELGNGELLKSSKIR